MTQRTTYRLTSQGELVLQRVLKVHKRWFLDDFFRYMVETGTPRKAEQDEHTWVEIVFLDHNQEKVFTLAQEVFMKLKDPQFGWTRRSWGRAFNYQPGYLAGYRIGGGDAAQAEKAPFIVCSLEEYEAGKYGWLVDLDASREMTVAELRQLCEKIIKAGGEGVMAVEDYPVLAK